MGSDSDSNTSDNESYYNEKEKPDLTDPEVFYNVYGDTLFDMFYDDMKQKDYPHFLGKLTAHLFIAAIIAHCTKDKQIENIRISIDNKKHFINFCNEYKDLLNKTYFYINKFTTPFKTLDPFVWDKFCYTYSLLS